MDDQTRHDRITALQNAADWNAAMAEQCEHEQRHADAGRHWRNAARLNSELDLVRRGGVSAGKSGQ